METVGGPLARSGGCGWFRKRAARLLLAGVIGCLAMGCSPAVAPPPRGLVLIVVDTLRADHLGAYGYARPTSPRLDRLAAEGVLFRDAVSPSPWTLPALATIMTSLYPSLHGAHSPSDVGNLDWLFRPKRFRAFSSLHESRLTLAEVLRASGFATFGAVQGSYPTSVFGMGQGFDVYRQNETPGVRFDVEDALAWLDRHPDQRFFVYLHVTEPHSPYTPIALGAGAADKFPKARLRYFEEAVAEEQRRYARLDFDPDYRGEVDGSRQSLDALSRPGTRVSARDLEHLVALYDRGVAYMDHWVGVLLDGLAARGLATETLIVITSDHGEEFLEHGRLEHSFSYYEEMLRVPLALRVPGEGRGVVVERTVGLVDVMPTVLDVLGVEAPAGLQGISLRRFWRGEDASTEPPTDYWGEASFRRGTLALRSGRWKYIRSAGAPASVGGGRAAREELYDLEEDPGERANLCSGDRVRCAPYRDRLTRWVDAQGRAARVAALPPPGPAELDGETLEELRALGYIE